MYARTTLTLTITSSLFGLYVFYALVMNSIIGVQTMEAAKPHSLPAPQPPQESLYLAKTFLAPKNAVDQSNAWVLDADYQVRSKGAFIWYNEWEHKEYDPEDPNNSVEFSPFALLVKQDQKRHPLTITSEKARIKFAHPFDLKNPDTGRPVAGALQGPVQITGPGGLLIKGQNFTYNEDAKQIWSDHPVKFWHGNHYGEADTIQIDVEIDPEAIAREEFAISGIQKIKLSRVRNDIVLLVHPEEDAQSKPIEIRCSGTVEFDTSTYVARFWKNVRVIRPTAITNLPDTLTCDLLKITSSAAPEDDLPLVTPEEPRPTEAQTLSKKRESLIAIPRNMKPELIRAETEGETPVVFHSAEQGLHARMNQFVYRVPERTIHMTRLDNVEITLEEMVFASPDITLVHTEDDELESLTSRGPGEMQYIPKNTGRRELVTRWNRELTIAPENSTGLTLIELDGEASITQPVEDSSLQGDHIRLWVSQVPGNASSAERPPPQQEKRLLGGTGKNLIPQKLLVLNNVQISTPDLVGKNIQSLNVSFVSDPNLTSRNNTASAMTLLPSRRAKSNQRSDLGLHPTSEIKPPAELEASDIEIVVQRATQLEDSWVESIVTSGDVVLSQSQNPLEPPLLMRGDRIEVLNSDASNQNQVVHLFGKPALIEDREMGIVGNQLHLDQKNNRAWVTGPGKMVSLVNSDLEGNTLPEPQLLSVLWREKMDFNGQTATFYDKVITTLDQSHLECQEMEVVLARKIDFSEERKPLSSDKKDKPKIDRLHCRYGVKIESRQTEEGRVVELRNGEFGELLFKQESGTTLAQGPGKLRIWRAGTPNRAGLVRGKETLTNSSMHTRETGWNFTQVEFNGIVEGNLNSKITQFRDRVQIIYGPVDEPGDLLDPDSLPEQGAWMTSQNLEITMHPKTKAEDAWITMRAWGNVDLEGFNFFAQADLVTYDESQKTYRMKAFGKSKAKISLQKYAGREPLDTEAQSIEYKPEHSYLKADGVTMFIGVSNSQTPSPK